MKVKKLLKGDQAREKIKEGIDLVADYTKVTLGPKGRNVALNQLGPLPTRVVNDGVTIAEQIASRDPFVQAGVEMVQEICKKTNFNAGDGTTQTALLAQAIINEGQKRLVTGYNPMDLKKEIEKDLESALERLGKMSHKVESVEEIRNIATIAGNNDPEIGDAVAGVMEKVGMNASIIIEKGNEQRIRTEAVKGIWFDKGYRVPAFINNPKMTAEYSQPNIFLMDFELKWEDEVMEFFKKIEQAGMDNIIIIANEIEGQLLYSLSLTNKARIEKGEGIYVCAIEAPFGGPDRKDFMEDIAIYTGGKVISKDNGCETVNHANPEEFVGKCDKIVVTSKTTTIIGGKGDEKAVKDRVAEIQGLIDQLDPNEKTIRENLEKRRDTLDSGVGIIYAGGSTEIEIKDRTLRLEDAVLASKSAIKEGYVPGGGKTYLELSRYIETDIMRNALQEPIKQIARNAGKNPESIVEKCLYSDVGYNAKTDEFEDMIKVGVIDATLVVKNALKNAVSLAVMFLTTEAIVAEHEEKEDEYNFGGQPLKIKRTWTE